MDADDTHAPEGTRYEQYGGECDRASDASHANQPIPNSPERDKRIADASHAHDFVLCVAERHRCARGEHRAKHDEIGAAVSAITVLVLARRLGQPPGGDRYETCGEH